MEIEKIVDAMQYASTALRSDNALFLSSARRVLDETIPIAQHLSETLPKVREALEYIESSARGSKRAAASWCKNLEGDFDVIEHKARECLRALTKEDGNVT